jgi:hypothetical protein
MSKFSSIDPAMLEGVIGGARPPVSPGITSGARGQDAQLLAAVQGIQSAVKDIDKKPDNNNMFMMAGLAMAMSKQKNQVAVVGGGPGYYYSSVG